MPTSAANAQFSVEAIVTLSEELTPRQSPTIWKPKPVLGVRRDSHNNRATHLIIFNRLPF